jgi:hypothetical protein
MEDRLFYELLLTISAGAVRSAWTSAWVGSSQVIASGGVVEAELVSIPATVPNDRVGSLTPGICDICYELGRS